MLHLQHKVSVYVCVEAQVETVVRHMCKEFGGATVTQSKGYWANSEGNLHIDNTVIVSSSTDKRVYAEHMGALLDWMFANSGEPAISVETSVEGLVIFDRADVVKEAKVV